MRRRPLLAVPALLLGLSGCGAGSLSADEVASGAEDALEEEVGIRPDITCPDELAAEVGAEMRCTLTAEGVDGEYGVTVTVTEVQDDTANFDVQVDEEPQG